MGKAKPEIIRFCLLLLGGLVGAALVVAFTLWKWEDYTAVPHDSFQRMAISLQGCILFIMAVYNTGYFGMRPFGIQDQGIRPAPPDPGT